PKRGDGRMSNLPTPEDVQEGITWAVRGYRLYRAIVDWFRSSPGSADPGQSEGEVTGGPDQSSPPGGTNANDPEQPPTAPGPPSSPPKPAEPLPGILVIGPGGTGKTTLARLLSGDRPADPLELPGEYVESMQIERYEVENPSAEVIVPPGQHRHR